MADPWAFGWTQLLAMMYEAPLALLPGHLFKFCALTRGQLLIGHKYEAVALAMQRSGKIFSELPLDGSEGQVVVREMAGRDE
jgi:hypothetical protein